VVRKAGLDGLAELGDPAVLSKVARYARPGNDRTYRHAAIGAYASLASKLDEGERDAAADFLGTMLDDWYLRTRREVINALRTLGDPAAIPYLERAARTDPLESLRVRGRRAAAAVRARTDDATTLDAIEAKVEAIEDRLDALDRKLRDHE
jgi:HEAT repeat protein